MNKIIGWTLIAAWILTWCSNNNETIKENSEEVKENITIVEDSVRGELIEVIDKKDDNNYRIKWRRIHKKNSHGSHNSYQSLQYEFRAQSILPLIQHSSHSLHRFLWHHRCFLKHISVAHETHALENLNHGGHVQLSL